MAGLRSILRLVFTMTFFYWLISGAPTPVQPGTAESQSELATFGLEWTGPIAPGGENHTFYGSASEIKSQIINTPGYDPSIFPTPVPVIYNETEHLLKRGGTYVITCSRGTSRTNGGTIAAYIDALKNLKELSSGSCNVRGPACKRMSCKLDSGLRLCVNRERPFNIECAELGRIAEIMLQAFISDFTGKKKKCRVLSGPVGDALFYSGSVHWSLDGKWWFVDAYYSRCLLKPWLTIPSPWDDRAGMWSDPWPWWGEP